MDAQKFPKYKDYYSFKDKLKRLLWNGCYILLFRPFGLPYFAAWRNGILKLFGAKIGKGTIIHASVKVWAPWNLITGIRTNIGPHAYIYNPGLIKLGNKTCISQFAFICTATHDYTSVLRPLIRKDIQIDDYAWVAASAFVGPGVHIGEYAVVGATASVYKDVEPYAIVGGNPAKFIKYRTLTDKE
ncbi:MAG: putative colanic acid biosynthesis acetyltransferase [Alloprevotella sp.]|nr:putative colanic acid biosynthesis acetyltransferase [Alloprevotella sp.]